ncbi:MAG: TlpA family protein disulfide reductase [Proteobacteria bacterium]|nr:TlpA family protein disulfide reductase [Pseudomonadota bacterium]
MTALLSLGLLAEPIKAPPETAALYALTPDHEGPLLVNFWASRCSPCAAELPLLAHLDDEVDDLRVVLVNIDHQRRRAEAMVRRLELDLPVIYDTDGELTRAFDPAALPSSWLLVEGEVRQVYEGVIEIEQVRRDVEAL